MFQKKKKGKKVTFTQSSPTDGRTDQRTNQRTTRLLELHEAAKKGTGAGNMGLFRTAVDCCTKHQVPFKGYLNCALGS